MSYVLEINNLYKVFRQNFKKFNIINGINLKVSKGEVFGFLGPNGAGKTTTMKLILDFIKPTSGEILIFGEKLCKNRSILSKVGYAPEQAYYYEHLTGEEFLYYMGKISGLSGSILKDKVNFYLDKLGLSFAGKKYIRTYSKGMKQRLGIASAIIHSPKLVFLDEPMTGLDPLGRNLVKEIMVELKKEGVTIFFNTHILSDVQDIADSFAIINKGEIIYSGFVKDVDIPLEDFFVLKVKETSNVVEIK